MAEPQEMLRISMAAGICPMQTARLIVLPPVDYKQDGKYDSPGRKKPKGGARANIDKHRRYLVSCD